MLFNPELTLTHYQPTPVGPIQITLDELGRLIRISFQNGIRDASNNSNNSNGLQKVGLANVLSQLEEYFCGERRTFDLNLQLEGTQFQKQVWRTLTKIPYGTTTSYGQLAANMGNVKSMRAVGQANGKNPIPIVIPCHRVIRADGNLGGFSAGLKIKQALLAIEESSI